MSHTYENAHMSKLKQCKLRKYLNDRLSSKQVHLRMRGGELIQGPGKQYAYK